MIRLVRNLVTKTSACPDLHEFPRDFPSSSSASDIGIQTN